jgi:hypothetical protein
LYTSNIVTRINKNMYTFNIIIADKQKRIKQAKMLHHMAAFLILIYGIRGFYHLPNTAMQLFTAIPTALIIFAICFFKKSYLQQPKAVKILRIVEASFILLGAIYFFKYKFFITAILFLMSAALILFTLTIELQLIIGFNIIVNDNGVIRLMGEKEKLMTWNTISNTMVKGGVLTIDLKNNMLIQSMYSNKFNTAQEEDFNSYCATKILISDV